MNGRLRNGNSPEGLCYTVRQQGRESVFGPRWFALVQQPGLHLAA